MSASKDTQVFVSKDDEDSVSDGYASDTSPASDDDERMGAVGPDGEIDWDCPCLAGMTTSPCGEQFKKAFSCFVASKDEPRGSDCFFEFEAMQTCLSEHPEAFGGPDDESDDDVPSDVEADKDEQEKSEDKGEKK
mmetsp:Transcript_27392/g.71870  ORF Transcript_27392/g.71870 Transcript_27392/m.71870 type:complete len:135 (+) Transcript_27392:36-440(+)|eukprot:CAMPEP_0182923066 /NCGR_PEP_ID=MMETSP0105_2-20130417/5196_1 /TAXON_ID=81532 ORGANISM="Acanthoeca-like sp., Strain 10tr" /NCGR_SAMPLE_ID=MMETSP0105_2 /ASSEMBLY_ACC=CAM_ASM_000205 /LENGTH=134 /DNA_ID=CAMNT_0025060745 /DNA_START=58 /DNA_END=462 /DNA_ORIENTATION=+